MLKRCWTVGIFSFHCVQCWDELPSSLTFKCWDLSGVIVSIIIPWGKKLDFWGFREALLPFSSWGFLEDAPIQLDITFAIQDAPTFWGPPGATHPLRASYFGELMRGHGTAEDAVNTPGRVPDSAVLFQPWVTLLSPTRICSVSPVPCGSLKEGQNSTFWGKWKQITSCSGSE